MQISKLKKQIPFKVFEYLEKRKFKELRPCQYKAIQAGLFKDNNLLVCTPTASGKTLVAELAALNALYHDLGKVIYVVPLRALAQEKVRDFKRGYPDLKIVLTSGDRDSDDSYLESLLRHRAAWLQSIKVVVVDEVHLLNDASRGPTLEVLITLLRQLLPKLQIVALSATIGNPDELASWLGANLVMDEWRPVRLDKGIYSAGKVEFW